MSKYIVKFAKDSVPAYQLKTFAVFKCPVFQHHISTANRETFLLISISVLLNSGTRVSRIRPVLF